MSDMNDDELNAALAEPQRAQARWMLDQGCSLKLTVLVPVLYLRKTALYRLEVQMPGGIVVARREGGNLSDVFDETYRATRVRLEHWSAPRPPTDRDQELLPREHEARSRGIRLSYRRARWYTDVGSRKT